MEKTFETTSKNPRFSRFSRLNFSKIRQFIHNLRLARVLKGLLKLKANKYYLRARRGCEFAKKFTVFACEFAKKFTKMHFSSPICSPLKKIYPHLPLFSPICSPKSAVETPRTHFVSCEFANLFTTNWASYPQVKCISPICSLLSCNFREVRIGK